MPQETNLNRTPYFDDFDADKDFHKVLFKPGYSVQARELTTLQSILQNQIEKFGTHFFKEGARVIPGSITYSLNYRSVQVEQEFLGLPISLYQDKLIGKQIKGSISGVIATVTNIEVNPDTNNIILYINYENSGSNFIDNLFVNGENLITLSDITFGLSNIIASGEEFSKVINSNSTQIGSAAFISEGVYFIRGYFVRVASQTIVLDRFSSQPTYRVGLFINEEIITSSQDESLYDNSRGFSNFTAPGADRLKISTSLSKKQIDNFEDENFIELLRLNAGVLEKIVDKTQYNIIAEELARRTYDESGDYYITPFSMVLKNTLNDRIDNQGLFLENQLTRNGNIPSDNLFTYKISPGKAYIRGFEVTKDNQSFIDIEKPRTTARVNAEGIFFNAGPSIFVTNTLGQPSVGIATTSILSLRSSRLGSPKTSPAGDEIGVARAYDFSFVGSTGITTTHQLRLFDVQTFTTIGLSTNISLSASSLIEGRTSGAKGYVKTEVINSTNITLYNVVGKFAKDESINVSGIGTYGHFIRTSRDYKLSEVNSIYSYRSTATNDTGFNADVLLDLEIPPTLNILNAATNVTIPSFTISARDPVTGISTVTSSTTNFIGVATVGNIISYTRPGFSTVTFNTISSISASGRVLELSSVASVPGICDGSTTTSTITTSDLSIRASKIQNISDPSFTTKLSKLNVKTIDTENTDVILKRQYNIASFSANTLIAPSLDTDFIYQPFSAEAYALCYSNGKLETLTFDKFIFTNGLKNLEIRNLSEVSGSNATLIVSLKKNKVKEKIKKLNKVNTLTISRSLNSASGIGGTTLNDGLSYSSVYGTRVQDNEICLNVPDVVKILGIFESSDVSEPDLPVLSFVVASLTGPNNSANDVLIGEKIIGADSSAVAIVVSKSTLSIEIVYLNALTFTPGELVSFDESKISGICNAVTSGDKNISLYYVLDDGQRLNYYDYGKIIKKSSTFNPSKKIKIIFQNYEIDSSDSGDVYTVDSYPIEKYSEISTLNGIRLSDLIDIRPRVSTYSYTSSLSPFEFSSRNFSSVGQSSPYQLAPNQTFITSFEYYLPRIDKIFLSKEGNFQLQKGVPADRPAAPKDPDGMLEIGTIVLPAYMYDINDAKLTYASHKRYRMQDICRLESRIATLEYYTQLSLLEISTDSLSIKTNGLDRFKCGFFVDNFKSHSAHDVSNPIFKSSIDIGRGHLRPVHYTTAIDLIGQSVAIGIGVTEDTKADYRYEENAQDENIKKNKKIVTLSYTDIIFAKNEFATRIENVTPFLVTSYSGSIELNPSSDTWVDTNRIDPNRVTIEGSYSSTIQQLNVNQNTGFSPIDWGAWQTDWIGVNVSSSLSLDVKEDQVLSDKTQNFSRTQNFAWTQAGRQLRSRTTTGRERTTTTADLLSIGSNVSVTNTANQSRQGIRWNVTEQIDSQMLGPRIVNNQFIRYMRARNIEFVARRLKPNTQVYSFFDSVDVNSYVYPKLIEILMTDRVFTVGESVNVYDPANTSQITATVRVAQSNHKYGPYNAPTVTYSINPYDVNTTIPNAYTSSSTILNIDTASLEEAALGKFYGLIKNGATLIGATSGARARVTGVRLITDNIGTIIGSFFVPQSNTLSFETGIKKFKLINVQNNNPIPGSINTSAEESFYSSGLLQTSQDTQLGIRNARVRRETETESRTLSSSASSSAQASQFINTTTGITTNITNITEAYHDPLAQSFKIDAPNGLFATKVDLFFASKPTTTNVPVIVQLRPLESGVPSTVVLPFSEIELSPGQITTSTDGTIATTVTFEAPVFLENLKEYAVVLLSDSTEYQVWISRMGEEDITTRNRPESARRIVSQQPTLGSLFKSQNGSTWEPSGYEDLKFIIYKAEFTTNPGSYSLYNPVEGGEYSTLLKINETDLSTNSNRLVIGLSTNISNYIGIVPGISIGITDKTISGNLIGIAGSVSTTVGFALTTYSVGTGYTTFRYDNLELKTITGNGRGLTVSAYFQDNELNLSSSGIVTVTNGGFGYRVGDIVGIPTSVGFGNGARLSVQTIGSFNTLILDNVQGNYDGVVGKRLTYIPSTGITSFIGLATVSYLNQDTTYDGLHFKVDSYNHGMYATNNLVRINGIKSDLKPAKLSAAYNSSETSNIQLNSVSIFNNFENVGVSSTNPGYIRIKNELISYTGVNSTTNTLTGITRGIDANVLGTDISGSIAHSVNDTVMKYEFNNVSLRRINRIHNMSSPLATVPNPIDIDFYHIKIDMSNTNYGINRNNNVDGIPNLFFSETKTGSDFGYSPNDYAITTKNIIYSYVTPNVNIFSPKGTGVGSRIRTISATSVDGSELSFEDQGFEQVQLNDINTLSSLRMIANADNENSVLSLTEFPGKKSFTLVIDLFTGDKNVSPVLDLERVNMILTSNRLNRPMTTWPGTDEISLETKRETSDPHAAVYISNDINLANSATSLKVLFSAVRKNTSEIRVMYKLIRKDSDDFSNVYEFFPGYENINSNGEIINPSENNGNPDQNIETSSTLGDFKDYEYSIDNLSKFDGFAIKIIMSGTDQANVPLIKDLRGIALA